REPPGPGDVYEVTPHPGLFIAFPSWLRHGVAPHNCETGRVCVAFNVTMEAP
ncbi:putative 2OG-Fe(II) oxygenase, partial [Streptomyces sp. WM6378]|uniref:putative 2OG-Fe(II) oxygenase n=1 Tax=Streptomyces sp. WM6378 TaxID=1415557 RepID=UPI000B209757